MTRARAITDGDIVLAEIELAVPPERAFEALNSAEVERWWGAPGLYRMESWQADRRAGGRWQVNVVLPDATRLPASGEYVLVQPPHRVAFTRRYDWDHPTLGRRVTKVVYAFEPVEEGTRLVVRQEAFGSPEAAHEHALGWERTLNLLGEYVSEPAP